MATGLYLGLLSNGQYVWTDFYDLTEIFSLRVDDRLGSGNDSATFRMLIPRGSTGRFPLSGQLVRLVVNDVKLFEGVVREVENTWLQSGPVAVELNCQAASYVHLLDRHLVSAKREEEPAGQRIRAILREFAPQFANNLTRIANGPTVPPQDYDYQTVTSVISSLARTTMYLWDVDYDGVVTFSAELGGNAPITSIDLDTYTVPGNIEISVAPVQANVVVIKDFSSRGRNKERHAARGDGVTHFYKLPMPPFSVEDTEVYVRPVGSQDWVKRILLEDPLDGSPESVEGVPGVAYLCTFNWGVRFPKTDMPQAGDDIRVDYNPEIPDRIVVVVDEDSIRECARRDGGDGRYEMYVSASDFRVADDSPIYRLGELILSRTAWPVVTGSMELRTKDYGSWRPGQTFTVYSEARDVYDVRRWVVSGYTEKHPQRVWVTSVSRSFGVESDGIWEYDKIEFSSQPWGEI